MSDEGDHLPTQNTEQRGGYRRRLAAAAVASVALHMILARSLAISHLGSPVTAANESAGKDPLTPKRKPADFPLEVSPSRQQRPAHEQPLDLAARPPAPRQPDRRSQQPRTAASDRRPPEPAEPQEATRVTAGELPRTRATTAKSAAAAPARQATAAASDASAAAADTTTIDAARAATTAAQPAPAKREPRTDAAPAAVASRWRPREVELLERLASRPAAPSRASRMAVADAADAPVADRRSTAATRPAADATADAITAPAPAAAARASAAAPAPATLAAAARLTARGARPGGGPAGKGTTASTMASAGSAAAEAGSPPGAQGSSAAGSRSAPAAAGDWVAARSGTRSGERSVAGDAGMTASTTPSRAATAASAGGDGTGGAGRADTIATGPAGGGGGGTRGDGSASGALAALPGPAATGRFGATGSGGGRSASALGSPRRGGEAAGTGDDEQGEGLSVGAAGAGDVTSGAARRRGAGDDPGLPRRIAAAALPVEGRVRDVSEAFAKRTSGGDARAGTEKVADRDVAKRAQGVVDRGLDFLARSQQADGRWRLGTFAGATAADAPKLESDTAATGLALLSFLGAGHDHFDGRYRTTVRRGLEFLLATQKPDGDLFLPADDLSNSCAWLYSHGIASMAVCEAVGMTGDPLIRPAAEQACRFIAASQHPTLGGWRYTPLSDADLSVSGWMLVAVRSGDLAGVKTDRATLPGVRRLLEAAAARDDATRYAYNPRKQDQRRSRLSMACMTAVGALMRLHTGDGPGDARVVAAGRMLAAIEPAYGSAAEKTRDSYLWYYASQVLVHTGGGDWNRWYGRLVDVLATQQETQGPMAGSWDPLQPMPDRWGEYGGRVYVTALHLLALEVPDRHLPTSAIGAASRRPEAAGPVRASPP